MENYSVRKIPSIRSKIDMKSEGDKKSFWLGNLSGAEKSKILSLDANPDLPLRVPDMNTRRVI